MSFHLKSPKSKFKSKLNNFPISDMADRLSQDIDFRALLHLLEALSKIYAQIFFQMFLYRSMQFFMGFLKMKSDLWGHAILIHFGSKYVKNSPAAKVKLFKCKTFRTLRMSDKVISSRQFCREFFSLSFETNRTSIG